MADISEQLDLLGLDETLRLVEQDYKGPSRTRALAKVRTVYDIKTSNPEPDDMGFLHTGLAQTSLPHSRLKSDSEPWMRSSGRFRLIVSPGVIADEQAPSKPRYVGVPYGSRARLIQIYLQTEAVKSSSRTVSLGPNLSSFMRSLGLSSATGGKNGSITSVREQCLRIAQCQFTMQWSTTSDQGRQDIIQNTRLVDGLTLWSSSNSDKNWSGTVELSERFLEHLREHSMPLDKRALAQLSDNSLGLDLYALLAYRLPKLRVPLLLRWGSLQEQIGTDYTRIRALSEKVKDALPDVKAVYPHANVALARGGMLLSPSPPAVQKTMVNGFTIAG
jgi:hypothetical protein